MDCFLFDPRFRRVTKTYQRQLGSATSLLKAPVLEVGPVFTRAWSRPARVSSANLKSEAAGGKDRINGRSRGSEKYCQPHMARPPWPLGNSPPAHQQPPPDAQVLPDLRKPFAASVADTGEGKSETRGGYSSVRESTRLERDDP